MRSLLGAAHSSCKTYGLLRNQQSAGRTKYIFWRASRHFCSQHASSGEETAGLLGPAPRCAKVQKSLRCVWLHQMLCLPHNSPLQQISLGAAHVMQLQTHLPASTMCALASGFDGAGPSGGTQHQALPPAAASAEREAPLRRITMRYKGKDDLREAKHMQPAAMELLTETQQALGSRTGLVLADTHASSYVHDPIKKIDCSGLAGDDRLCSQLVVPIEFKLYNEDADAAFGQLVEVASIVQGQQPDRGFICAVAITMDTVEVFSLRFGGLAGFSSISSSSPLPLMLLQGSPGLRMLARVLAAPLAQLGFVSAPLPEGRLGPHTFECTGRLALCTVSTSTPSRQNRYVFKAKLTERGDSQAVLKLAFNDKEVRFVSMGYCWHDLVLGGDQLPTHLPSCQLCACLRTGQRSAAGATRQQGPCFWLMSKPTTNAGPC